MRFFTAHLFLVALSMCALSVVLLINAKKHKSPENKKHCKEPICTSHILSVLFLSAAGAITTYSVKAGLIISMMLVLLYIFENLAGYTVTKKRRNIVGRELPLLLDFLVLQVESGHSIQQAFGYASRLFPEQSPVNSGLNKFQENIRLGSSVQTALEELAEFLDTANSRTALQTISQAIKHGTPIGGVLRNQANRMRERLVIEGEKFAQTISIKLLIPLLFFIFPASFLIIFSPVIVSITRTLK